MSNGLTFGWFSLRYIGQLLIFGGGDKSWVMLVDRVTPRKLLQRSFRGSNETIQPNEMRSQRLRMAGTVGPLMRAWTW